MASFDSGVFGLALASVSSGASGTSGTWTSGTSGTWTLGRLAARADWAAVDMVFHDVKLKETVLEMGWVFGVQVLAYPFTVSRVHVKIE